MSFMTEKEARAIVDELTNDEKFNLLLLLLVLPQNPEPSEHPEDSNS